MFDFRQVAPGLYGIYKNGRRVTPYPLTREELDKEILDLHLTEKEVQEINIMFDSASEDLICSCESERPDGK